LGPPHGRTTRNRIDAPATAPSQKVGQESITPKISAQAAANDRDLELLQGNWRTHKVYHGHGHVDATAIDGGPVTIEGKQFRKKVFDAKGNMTDLVATISRIDAAKDPKELDLAVEAGDLKGKTVHLIYVVGDARLEFF
jgi:uncharacterized protein (TIGR03067 family)